MRNVFEGYTSVEDEIMIQFAHYQMEELRMVALSKKTTDKIKCGELLGQAINYDNLQLGLIKQYMEEVGYDLPLEMILYLENRYVDSQNN